MWSVSSICGPCNLLDPGLMDGGIGPIWRLLHSLNQSIRLNPRILPRLHNSRLSIKRYLRIEGHTCMKSSKPWRTVSQLGRAGGVEPFPHRFTTRMSSRPWPPTFASLNRGDTFPFSGRIAMVMVTPDHVCCETGTLKLDGDTLLLLLLHSEIMWTDQEGNQCIQSIFLIITSSIRIFNPPKPPPAASNRANKEHYFVFGLVSGRSLRGSALWWECLDEDRQVFLFLHCLRQEPHMY